MRRLQVPMSFHGLRPHRAGRTADPTPPGSTRSRPASPPPRQFTLADSNRPVHPVQTREPLFRADRSHLVGAGGGTDQFISITLALAPLARPNSATVSSGRRRPCSAARESWSGRVAAPMFPVRWKVGTTMSARTPRRALGDDHAVRLPWATRSADALLRKEYAWVPGAPADRGQQ